MSNVNLKCLYMDWEACCWPDETPIGYQNDILQIGIACVNLGTCDIRHAHYYIRPVRPYVISEYCTELTGITPELINSNKARKLGQVVHDIGATFHPLKKLLVTWGDDMTELSEQCHLVGAENPFGKQVLNLSLLFHHAFALKHPVSLEQALAIMGMSFQGRPHDALDDARNTAFLHLKMLRNIRPSTIWER